MAIATSKSNALLLIVISRNGYVENETTKIAQRVSHVEENIPLQRNVSFQIGKLAEGVAEAPL